MFGYPTENDRKTGKVYCQAGSDIFLDGSEWLMDLEEDTTSRSVTRKRSLEFAARPWQPKLEDFGRLVALLHGLGS